MSKTSTTKQPMSGLRSIKRDFSSNSLPPASQESTSSDSAVSSAPATQPKKLSGLEQRLKDIQDALKGQVVSSQTIISSSQSQISSSSSSSQKRPSTSQNPPAKRRQLPDTWKQESKPASGARGAYPSTTSTTRAFGTTRQVGNDNNKKSTNETQIVPVAKSGAASKPAPVFLSQEQTHILKLVENGLSLFYTGSAGAGKSVLLREIIRVLRKKNVKSPDAVAVTASTGIAACNVGGVTIHSFAGIGIGEGSIEELATRVRKNKKAMTRWLRTKVLIIDEVSMLDGDLFDKLAQLGSRIRKNVVPFGGIQVVVTGDFFQLPPVTKGRQEVKFAFEAEYWPQTIKKTFNLTKVFRQRDPEFVDMLNEMRFGRLSQKSIARFRSLAREIVYEDGLGATELFPRREDVERSNAVRMHGIDGREQTYTAYDGGLIVDPQQRDKMLQNFMAPKRLVLKEGAQVMLIKNLDDTLVNGTMGKIVRFVDPNAALENEDEILGKTQPGSKSKQEAAAAAAKPAAAAGSGQLLPVVEFLQPGGHLRTMIVAPDSWKVELPSGEVQVSRTQLPLILSWAMSIHKSQGQTLERVKVDLRKVFEKGQAYVALSRATSLDGLQVLNFDPALVKAHPKVVEWSKTLETV